jgi:hypothetical protein
MPGWVKVLVVALCTTLLLVLVALTPPVRRKLLGERPSYQPCIDALARIRPGDPWSEVAEHIRIAESYGGVVAPSGWEETPPPDSEGIREVACLRYPFSLDGEVPGGPLGGLQAYGQMWCVVQHNSNRALCELLAYDHHFTITKNGDQVATAERYFCNGDDLSDGCIKE